MRKLLSLMILLFMLLIGCKQEPKTNIIAEESKNEENKPQETTENKEQTIEEFLKQLQTSVKNDDVATIEKSLKFPFEFNWGGESSFYNSYKEIKEDSGKFSYILEISSIDKEGDMFILSYQQPNVPDYFVDFIAIKDGDSFKLTSFMQPH